MLKAIHRMQRDERGFTLVELLIVIAIIAILAAIAIPQFSKYRKNAAKSTVQSDTKNCLSYTAAEVANNPSLTGSVTCPYTANTTGSCSATIGNDAAVEASCTGVSGGLYTGKCTINSTNGNLACDA